MEVSNANENIKITNVDFRVDQKEKKHNSEHKN